MSGLGVSAARLALPDTGMTSYAEMLDQGRNICQAVRMPVIGDGDTGYGNAINVKRTVKGYADAGLAAHHDRGSGEPEAFAVTHRASRWWGERKPSRAFRPPWTPATKAPTS